MNKETHWVIISDIKRKMFLKTATVKFVYRNQLKVNTRSNILNMYSNLKIQKYSKFNSICFVNNRCLVSGRGYSIKNRYKLSRFFLRKNYNRLAVSGLRRASW